MNEIITGDARELAKSIPDESIDLIFTDPPYLRDDQAIYEWLGHEAVRVLKPGGFLLTYVGSLWKYDNMMQLGKHLTFFYDYVTIHAGHSTVLWNRKTISRHKSILAFVKGVGQPRCMVQSTWTGTGQDKRFHRWGQDESTARYYIDCFSSLGDTVWEPFTGGGTTLVACKVLDRNFIAFEVDLLTADIARKRLETTQPLLFTENAEQEQMEWSDV